MASPVVVIVFHCTSGATETLAMSAAVGAVQSRALIRLRRVPGETDGRSEAAMRMQKEYVPPAEADVLGADGLVIVAPPDARPTSPEWQPFITMIERLGAEGKLAGKVGAIVQTGDAQTTLAFSMALLAPGLVVVPTTSGTAPDSDRAARATEHGRRVGELAKSLKPA